MSFISICGGGGKTTICNKYPELFLDIDSFIWSEINKEYHKELITIINSKETDKIGEIYKTTMIKNKDKINKDKIILGHHPINAEWLNIKCIYSIKPNKKLHELNIKNRNIKLQKIARNCWYNLKEAIIYNSYVEFENLLLQITKSL